MVELAGIIVLGIVAQWISWRLRLPAILPLILIGLFVGPISTLWTEDGSKLIEPRFNGTEGFFPGESLFWFVSLAIGVILFEGGLTLKRKEIQGVGSVIVRLITLGSIVTFIGAGLLTHILLDLSWSVSFLFGGLIIVTGPTVIAPILRNVPLNRNVSTVLKWEGILIDPIGALVAVLVFEFIISGKGGGDFTLEALGQFLKIIVIGVTIGGICAYLLYQLIKRDWVPHYLLNVFTLASVLFVFVLSDLFAHESGLLSVVIMGMVLGNLDTPKLKHILDFKESISVLLISILFILLAANINIAELQLLLNWRCFLIFGVIVLVLRPMGVFLSTFKSEMRYNEKLYIGWIGPRGIVAAGIASLFGIELTRRGVPGAEYITPLVFMIVLGTVLLTASTARSFAKLLGVTLRASNGILIIGANKAARLIGKYLKDNNRHVVLIDINATNIDIAKEAGLEAFEANIYADDLNEKFELLDMGYLMAMTGNAQINEYACKKFNADFGENGTFRLVTTEEMKLPAENLPDLGLFSANDDYINLSEVARDYPEIHELPLESRVDFYKIILKLNTLKRSIPLFVKANNGKLEVIPAQFESLEIEEGDSLVYLGQPIPETEDAEMA